MNVKQQVMDILGEKMEGRKTANLKLTTSLLNRALNDFFTDALLDYYENEDAEIMYKNPKQALIGVFYFFTFSSKLAFTKSFKLPSTSSSYFFTLYNSNLDRMVSR